MASSTTSVITHHRRVNLAKITRGEVETIPKITHIAFGSGGVDESGQPIQPLETMTALNNEVGRYEIEKVETPLDTTNRYTVTIPESDLNGVNINEMALVDAEGQLAAVKTFLNKGKDGDVEFTFQFDDEF